MNLAYAPDRLAVRPGAARMVLLLSAFVCAACGLVYELALITLGSYLMGNSVVQASLVLSVFVFSMGVGALVSKGFRRQPVLAFAVVEAALALVGGLSVLVLYAAFAWLDLYQPALLAVSFLLGGLVGAEIPLLMTLIQTVRPQDAGAAVADLSAADYVGALVGGLAFPFLLLPRLGQLQGPLLVGALNAVAAAVLAAWLFAPSLRRRQRGAIAGGLAVVLAVLAVAGVTADRFEVSARQALFDDPIVLRQQTQYQEIVLTESVSLRGERDLRLFLNGDLQFSSVDEYRYHEALVHPAMAGPHRRVLVLGGGDGLAVREVLRYPEVAEVVLVELDPEVIRLARDDRRLVALNDRSLHDPRVRVVGGDAFSWLGDGGHGLFDVVLADLPDADSTATAKLYTQEFYAMAAAALSPPGRMVVQGGSPSFARHAFWCVDATLRAAGLRTLPYHVEVPSFGDWGFVLSGRDAVALRLPAPGPDLRSLDADTLRAAATFPPDRRSPGVDVSTLLRPVMLDYSRMGWRGE